MDKKRLKIWKSPWHVSHDFDLIQAFKPIADFYLLINYTRRWDEKNRPIPENVEWVTHFEKGKYDLVILNIDQQCTNLDLNKSLLTRQMKESVRKVDKNVPIIFINHGTPVYPESYPDGNFSNNYISQQLIGEIMQVVGDDLMVVNSKQAAEDWGGGDKIVPIIHGMEANEWLSSDIREPRSCTYVSHAGIGDKYYNRSFLSAVMEELWDKYGIRHQWINTPGSFQCKNGIKDYKEFLSKSLVYFNPTFASPMPRSRTEAMLSGCCVVTTPTHDADSFIKDGYNGFIVPHNNVEYAADVIGRLINDYKTAKDVGQRGKETAIKLFNRERYFDDWKNLFVKLGIL